MNVLDINGTETNDKELFSAYFKKDSKYYLNRLDRYRNGNKYSFNGYAFFFGIFWFMYRKMYVEALIITLIILAEDFMQNIVTAYMSETMVGCINRITTIVVAVITALLANALYIRKAESEIAKAERSAIDRTDLINRLAQKGGVSYWFLIVAFVVVAGIAWYLFKLNN